MVVSSHVRGPGNTRRLRVRGRFRSRRQHLRQSGDGCRLVTEQWITRATRRLGDSGHRNGCHVYLRRAVHRTQTRRRPRFVRWRATAAWVESTYGCICTPDFGPRCSPTLVTSTPSVKSAAYPRCQSCACQMAKAQARPTPCLRRLPTHPTESLAQKREQATDVRPPQGVPPSSAVRARERHLRS